MSICEPRREFSEHLAIRVLELEAALRAAKWRGRNLEASRNMWRNRAMTEHGRGRAVAMARRSPQGFRRQAA